MAKNFEENYKI